LGRDETIHTPQNITKLNAQFSETKDNRIECMMNDLPADNLRIIVQQYSSDGNPYRTWAGAPPNGTKMDQIIKIIVKQDDKEIETKKEYDKMIWSGLSWGVVEVEPLSLDKSKPLFIQCSTTEKQLMTLKADVYAVKY
jgi:hypothetical protein